MSNKSNPIILLYSDGSVVTKSNDLVEIDITRINSRGNVQLPVAVFAPATLVSPDVVEYIKRNLHPLVGSLVMYPISEPIKLKKGLFHAG